MQTQGYHVNHWYSLLSVFWSSSSSDALEITHFHVPRFVDRKDQVVLDCRWLINDFMTQNFYIIWRTLHNTQWWLLHSHWLRDYHLLIAGASFTQRDKQKNMHFVHTTSHALSVRMKFYPISIALHPEEQIESDNEKKSHVYSNCTQIWVNLSQT